MYSPLSLRFGGGFEHWLLEIATRLKKFGVNTSFLCTSSTVDGENRRFSESISDVIHSIFRDYTELSHMPLSFGNFNLTLPHATGLKKMISSLDDYDLLYFTNAYFLQDVLVASMKFLHKKPVISGHHAVLFQNAMLHDVYVRTIGRKCLSTFDSYHVLNSHDSQILRSWGLNRVFHIPIGVDTDKFRPEPREKCEPFRVLFVGRLVEQKGVDILCKAIGLINEAKRLDCNVGIEFVIVGVGPLEKLVIRLSKKYSNVKYMSCVSEEVLPEIYRGCDLFVLPSRRETFGIVALEAQASGLPVISSNITGPKDIVVNNVTGKLISTSPESLADSIKDYYKLWCDDYETYKWMSLNARENVLSQFGWDLVAKNMYELLKDSCDLCNSIT